MLIFLVRLRQRLVYSGHGGRAVEYTLVPTNWLPLKKSSRRLCGIWNIDHPISWAAKPVWLSEAWRLSKEVACFSLLMMRSRLWGAFITADVRAHLRP